MTKQSTIDEVEATVLPALTALPPPWNLSSCARAAEHLAEMPLGPNARVRGDIMHALSVALQTVARCPQPELPSLGAEVWQGYSTHTWRQVINLVSAQIDNLADYSRPAVHKILYALSPALAEHTDAACHEWLYGCADSVAVDAALWMQLNVLACGASSDDAGDRLLELAQEYDEKADDLIMFYLLGAAAFANGRRSWPLLRRIRDDEARSQLLRDHVSHLLTYTEQIENRDEAGPALSVA
jgi:hypothetical protein